MLVVTSSDDMCSNGLRGCPFINAAAEHLGPADPVYQAVLPDGNAFAGSP